MTAAVYIFLLISTKLGMGSMADSQDEGSHLHCYKDSLVKAKYRTKLLT